MAEKILNTRIQLKIDELSVWESSTIGLKKGEIAIATVSAAAGKELAEPVIMMKVGEDGIKTFSQLSWALHAKASDVYGWAKQSGAQFVDNFLAMAGADGTTMQAKLDNIFATDAALTNAVTQLQDELTTALTSYYTKTEVDDLVAGAKTYAEEKAAAAESAAKAYTDEEINKITTGAGYATTKYVDDAVAAHETAVNTKFESYSTTAQMNAAIDADVLVETNRAKAAEEALGERINGKQDIIPENTYDAYGAAATAEANAKAHTNAMVEQYLTGEGAADTIDTLAEIAAWINNEDAGATKIIADVATNTANISTLSGNLDKVVNGTTPVAKATDADTVDGKHASDFATSNQGANADTAYGWGDHAQEGYLKAADIEDKVDKIPGATEDHIVLATQDGGIKESGHTLADFATAEQGAKADSAIQSVGFEGLDGTPVLKVDEDTTTLNGANGVSVKINDTFDTINIELDTTTKNKIDNAVQTVIFAEGADLSNDYEARSRWGINVDNNTIVAFGSSDTISAGGEFDESADSHYVAKFNVKDHSISAHHTKACADYTGEDAEVWVFNCGSATVNV